MLPPQFFGDVRFLPLSHAPILRTPPRRKLSRSDDHPLLDVRHVRPERLDSRRKLAIALDRRRRHAVLRGEPVGSALKGSANLYLSPAATLVEDVGRVVVRLGWHPEHVGLRSLKTSAGTNALISR